MTTLVILSKDLNLYIVYVEKCNLMFNKSYNLVCGKSLKEFALGRDEVSPYDDSSNHPRATKSPYCVQTQTVRRLLHISDASTVEFLRLRHTSLL